MSKAKWRHGGGKKAAKFFNFRLKVVEREVGREKVEKEQFINRWLCSIIEKKYIYIYIYIPF